MFGRRSARAFLVSAAITGTCFILPGQAQTILPAPVRQNVDANGVDLFLGTISVDGPALTVGAPGAPSIIYRQVFRGTAYADNVNARLYLSGSTVTISFGTWSDRFTVSGSVYTPTEGYGATLNYNSSTLVYTYTTRDGVVYNFKNLWGSNGATSGLADVTWPNGRKLTYSYGQFVHCKTPTDPDNPDCTQYVATYSINSIVSNDGYELDFNRDGDSAEYPGTFIGVSIKNTLSPTTVRNQGYDNSGANLKITDAMGRLTQYRFSLYGIAGVTNPGRASEDVTVTYDTSNRVQSVTTPVGTTSYAYSDSAGIRTTTVTDPGGHATIYTFDIALQRKKSMTLPSPISKTTNWQYDVIGRMTRVTLPEGNYTQYTYDGRGNVTETRDVAKSGSGLADRVTMTGFDTACVYVAKCNKPNWTKDALGNQTDYTYDTTTGNALTVALPAAVSGGVRPTTTNTYTTTSGVQLLAQTSTCQTTASCVGTADEVKTTIGYNSNLLANSSATASGTGSVTATTAFTYDDVGNQVSIDRPLGGTGDTTTYRYDADRELVGVINADPDGAGSRKRLAVRTTFNDRGVVTKVERGTVNGITDTDWAALVSAQQTVTTLDAADRQVQVATTSGGTTYSLTQYSYDADGRLDCSAVRMNTAIYGSLPTSACTLGTAGSAGPDQITKYTYDNADRTTKVTSGYATTDASDDVTTTYSDNGKQATVTDAEANKTTYTYDGFDRLLKTQFPGTTKGSGTSSTTDYEQLGYDANGNVTSRRLRDATTINYSYDLLNRLKVKDLPGSELDVTYSYDLLGRMTGAATSAQTISQTWDALGRQTGETGPLGTIGFQYDAAGNRTAITWPDGAVTTYGYDATSTMTGIYQGAGTSTIMTAYGYDDLGRRISMASPYSAGTGYSYDAVSRLSGLTQSFTTTANNVGFSFTYNPAGQIASRASNNDGYAWTGAANADRNHTANGLNQYTAAGTTSFSYDARGNLTTSGSLTYGYSSENLLTTAPGATLTYDPLGRLYQVATSGTTTRFQYIDGQIAAEYNGSNTRLRRFVPGAAIDQPAFAYEGAGTTTPTWYHTDERGSVIATSNTSGARASVNSYDEYGIPAAGNTGRLQYTGQAYLSEIGLSYYKARIYSPTLGRFMQTDPIGYSDGPNWYTYVHGDPVNRLDSTGLDDTKSPPPGNDPPPIELRPIKVWGYQPDRDDQDFGFWNPFYTYGWSNPSWLLYPGVQYRPSIGGRGPSFGGINASSISAIASLTAGEKVANGHAFDKHVLEQGDLAGLNLRTITQFAQLIDHIIANPSASKSLSRGRQAYWDSSTGIVVIVDPNTPDGGTAFRPSMGRIYYDGLS